jgi:hypothetical protein
VGSKCAGKLEKAPLLEEKAPALDARGLWAKKLASTHASVGHALSLKSSDGKLSGKNASGGGASS